MMPFKSKIQKWALLIHKFEPTEQIFKLVYNLNRRFETARNPLEDFVVFYDVPAPQFMPILFPIMQMAEAWSFDGSVTATNLQLAQRMLSFPGPKQKHYYMWDLEWTLLPNKNYESLANVYRNSHINLLTRAPSHHKMVRDVWGAESTIVEDFNLEALTTVVCPKVH